MVGSYSYSSLKPILPKKAESIINQRYDLKPYEDDFKYDLVYIVKESDKNPDLAMSLRSIEKFCNFRKVWLVGYKPSWVQNVEYIPTVQKGNKWKNSVNNYIAACKCKDISKDFILMNDDFFAIKPIRNWRENLNVSLGSFDDEAKKYQYTNFSRWQGGFVYGRELLNELDCKNRNNYESHLPIMINKKNFLAMLKLPQIKEFMETKKVLHKRSIYKNLYPEEIEPRIIRDVKIRLNSDLLSLWLNESWLSVFDYVVGNDLTYPKANRFLNEMFPEKSSFEI